MSVKIKSLQIENVKRVKAVEIKPTADGLTIIGGGNGQGKTSVIIENGYVKGVDGVELPNNWSPAGGGWENQGG